MTGKATVKRGPQSRPRKRRRQDSAAVSPRAGDVRFVEILRAEWVQRDAGAARLSRDERTPV